MNIIISKWHNSSFDSTKMNFLLYFNSLHDYWPPTTSVSLVHNSGEKKWCEKRDFQLFKMQKMKVSWNIKTKCVTDILLPVRSSSIKVYTFHYLVSTYKTNVYINFNKSNENYFFFKVTVYLNTRKSFRNLHVCRNGFGKKWLHIHCSFLQEF